MSVPRAGPAVRLWERGAHTTDYSPVQGRMEENHGKTGARCWESHGRKRFQGKLFKQVASELNPWETGWGMKSKSEEEIGKMMIRWWDRARSRRDCRSDDDLSCVLTGPCSWFCRVLRRGLHHLHTAVCPCPRAVSPGRLGLGLLTVLSFPSNT